MSSHSITMFSPTLNCDVDICVGFDSALSEAFITFESPVRDYMSHGKKSVDQLKAIALERLGIELPTMILAVVEKDIIDTRMGQGADVSQRCLRWEPHAGGWRCSLDPRSYGYDVPFEMIYESLYGPPPGSIYQSACA